MLAYGFSLLHSSKTALLLTTDFPSQRTVRVKALQLVLQTFSAALIPPTHAFDGVLGLAGRTASQIELSSYTNCSASKDWFWTKIFDEHLDVGDHSGAAFMNMQAVRCCHDQWLLGLGFQRLHSCMLLCSSSSKICSTCV